MAKKKFFKDASIGTAVFSVISLKLCCWGPLLLTSVAGVSGSSVYFAWISSFKPFLLTIAFLSLGVAFYQVYSQGKTNASCSGNCKTENKPFLKSKLYIWLIAGIVMLMSVIDYFPRLSYQSPWDKEMKMEMPEVETILLHVKGMSCAACEGNIRRSVRQIDGVVHVNASYEKGTAEIMYDKAKTSKGEIKAMMQSMGYVVKGGKISG